MNHLTWLLEHTCSLAHLLPTHVTCSISIYLHCASVGAFVLETIASVTSNFLPGGAGDTCFSSRGKMNSPSLHRKLPSGHCFTLVLLVVVTQWILEPKVKEKAKGCLGILTCQMHGLCSVLLSILSIFSMLHPHSRMQRALRDTRSACKCDLNCPLKPPKVVLTLLILVTPSNFKLNS